MSIHRSERGTCLSFLNLRARVAALVIALAVGVGCGGESATAPPPAADADEQYFFVHRVRSPDLRLFFATLLSDLETPEVDLTQSLELTGLSRFFPFEDKVYGFNGESNVITRFRIEDGDFVPDTLPDGSEARFSMSGEGVDGFNNLVVFINSERAYFIDALALGQVVVWNPTEMRVDASFRIPELSREGFTLSVGEILRVDDLILLPVGFVNRDQLMLEPKAQLAVFSASEDRFIGLIEDERCVAARSAFLEDGAVYVMADAAGGIANLLDPDSAPACLLRWVPGQTEFDPEFHIDLRALTGFPFVAGAVSRGDGTFATRVFTGDLDPTTLVPTDLIEVSAWQWAIVDYRAGTTTLVEGIPPSRAVTGAWIIDGEYVLSRFDFPNNESQLFEVRGRDARQLLSLTGQIFLVERLR
ncbi:MAG: hypothetical protein AAF500_14985 [Myxococcota bacterium]